MKKPLTITLLQQEALKFCQLNSGVYHPELFGVTDGKAIGTYVEHLFKNYLSGQYEISVGNTANGLDLPSVNTDIKVTSITRPQSSCPFKDSKQKIFGLGYNLIVFVYDKHDDPTTRQGMLKFLSCSFIDKTRTADYQTTTGLQNIIKNNGNLDDIAAFLAERNIPADEPTLYHLAEEILNNPPSTGYLTISNALQWRLHYSRVVTLNQDISGITRIIRYTDEPSD